MLRKLMLIFAAVCPLMGTAQNYRPEGRALVSVNGTNRFTRALYGGPTDYRVETSDRPVFAIYKKNQCRHVQFRLNGVALDEADHCEARYEDGMRSYVVRHRAWGSQAVVRLKVVASLRAEQAWWRVQVSGFEGDARLEVSLHGIRHPRLSRNGDIGIDPADAFEADGHAPLQQCDATFDDVCYVSCLTTDDSRLSILSSREGEEPFDEAEQAMTALASRVEFSTPDPYINPLGGALVVAADGDWDGQTWLHGCVGWRMPLAGWRAGYLGDVLGWPDRAVSHFDAYARSQVTGVTADVPHPTQDEAQQLARARKEWHTPMYSDGYICRNPGRNDQMHHYDMNLNYIDELLWHFQYDADPAYLRKMWPVLKRHLAWEKRNFDPDGDHLYDAYCCIWASDALYYSGGAVTHSSAYNYRANRLAARVATLIGQDGSAYAAEADAILHAMNQRLWMPEKGHWAEFQDLMGLKRRHESAAVWSIYTPIDCGACTPAQAYQATKYVDTQIPHIAVGSQPSLQTISTSNWMPYSWSINNVAAAEVMHTALAYFQAGRADEGFRLLKANVVDQMYDGQSPANFGQISQLDAARGECYRDFGDCIGISARALIQGLFGIQPDALNGRLLLHPGFPAAWDSASVRTPYFSYRFRRQGGEDVYDITQNLSQPLRIVVRQNLGMGQFRDIEGTTERHQVIRVKTPVRLPEVTLYDGYATAAAGAAGSYGLDEPVAGAKYHKQNLDRLLNASVADIYRNKYVAPRPPYTTLQIPLQGVGDWCHPHYAPLVDDSVFRSLVVKDELTLQGVPFRTHATGPNIVYTSLWDNYPDSVQIPLSGKYQRAWLLMAGSTNHMQSRIANGLVVARYQDGTADTLQLINPDNWCPIERDYFVDGKAFYAVQPRPYRVALASGVVSRQLGEALHLSRGSAQGGELNDKSADGGEIPGGAAQMLCLRLDPKKKLAGLTLRTLSNDVVIGLMALTLQ